MWQELRTELYPQGVEIVTVALDTGGPDAVRQWIQDAHPDHPCLLDIEHVTDALLGFVNVPSAVWIDEDGVLVRPAHVAQIKRSTLRDMDIPDGLPERLNHTLIEVKKINDTSDRYVPALRDWAAKGRESSYALSPDEVVARSRPRPKEHSEAAANFELGQHLWRSDDKRAAVEFFRVAHALAPENWTYKRQAWTLATTPEGEASDLLQGPTDLYNGNWLDDIRAIGADRYYEPLDF